MMKTLIPLFFILLLVIACTPQKVPSAVPDGPATVEEAQIKEGLSDLDTFDAEYSNQTDFNEFDDVEWK